MAGLLSLARKLLDQFHRQSLKGERTDKFWLLITNGFNLAFRLTLKKVDLIANLALK